MSKIRSVRAQEILDSRGIPTVAAEVALADGCVGWAAVPSGASTGEHEAVELRDGDWARHLGKGVLKAVANVQDEIAKAVKGMDAAAPAKLDKKMLDLDDTPNKGRLGANAILAVSMAAARAQASSAKLPLYAYLRKAYGLPESRWLLPTPMFNVVNGGRHADSGLDVQEFMVVPTETPSFKEAVRAGAEVYQVLKQTLIAMKMTVAVGDEGGFAPKLKTHSEVLDVLAQAIADAGYAGKVRLALDCAASEYFQGGKYVLEGQPLSCAEVGEVYAAWVAKHVVVSIEDPLAEDDWAGWKALTAKLGDRVRIIGDDLFVTNPRRLARGIKEKSANAVLIKLNQIGTLTETVEAVLLAQKSGFSAVISHRSGETEDAFIADLAVALNAGAIKTGAPCRSERLAKYNRLLQIETALGAKAEYAGAAAFRVALTAR
ncbi:MAG TPA: phosphopyruvate hydratase [Elusimicrobia bacterium]|nr:MAG: phosphopyruvate hydratase [Elusimicrobia bacterium GWA2_66_18]OGR68412.1 MAG: phosphopyruvate hydratase [Elusimicrobia bacterium GWC2_65_9]HAZ09032.1 phosphopyruvate hydratase [Elusimicrobiota bacterium]